jgi:hypothetical protein
LASECERLRGNAAALDEQRRSRQALVRGHESPLRFWQTWRLTSSWPAS